MRNYIKIGTAKVDFIRASDSSIVRTDYFCYDDDDVLVERITFMQSLVEAANPGDSISSDVQAVFRWFKMNKQNVCDAINSGAGVVFPFYPPIESIWLFQTTETAWADEIRKIYRDKSPRKKGRHG